MSLTSVTSTLTQCELSKVSFHQKFCIYVPGFSIINFICSTCCSYKSLDLTSYICYSHPANIRFFWPTKTSGWSRRTKKVDLHVLFHSVNLLNNINPPLLIVPACHILAKMHGLYVHPIKICLCLIKIWGCLSYKRPSLKIHPKFGRSKAFVSWHVSLIFLLFCQFHYTVTCHGLSQRKPKLRQCQNRLCVYTNSTYSCSFCTEMHIGQKNIQLQLWSALNLLGS